MLTQDCWIGLNFANDGEGAKFNEAVQKHIETKRQKKSNYINHL